MSYDTVDREVYEEGKTRQYTRRPDIVPTKVGWKCKGICSRLLGASSTMPTDQTRGSVYINYARCTTCDMYIPLIHIEKFSCPCCRIKVRTKPRNTDHVMMVRYKKEEVRY